MAKTQSAEQRTKRRIPFTVVVECREKDGQRRHEMEAHDISPEGARLKSSRWAGLDRCPKVGSKVTLKGLVYTESGSVPLEGRVAWAKPKTDDASFELGLKFLNPNKTTVLKEFDKWEKSDWSKS